MSAEHDNIKHAVTTGGTTIFEAAQRLGPMMPERYSWCSRSAAGTLVPYMLPLLLLLSAMVRVLMGAMQPFLL